MTVTQQGRLSLEDRLHLLAIQADVAEAKERLEDLAVKMVAKSSFREVSRITGLSTATLQRWVREAKP